MATVGRGKEKVGGDCIAEYGIKFPPPYGITTYMSLTKCKQTQRWLPMCHAHEEQRNDGQKLINTSKISFAPKEFYYVLNRHLKKNETEEEHRR